MAIRTIEISKDDFDKIVQRGEGHFVDFKSRLIAPASLSKSLSAFANADGGELFVGIAEGGNGFSLDGFGSEEDANGHIQAFESVFPLGTHHRYEFLKIDETSGLVLHIEIDKSPDVKKTTSGEFYLRRGAQNLKMSTPEQIERLKLNKGLISFEDMVVNGPIEDIVNSSTTAEFISRVVPSTTAAVWFKKQRLIVDGRPTVAGVVLFSDEPQILLPKAAIKIYRYKTSESAGSRDTLAFDPLPIESNAYDQIGGAVELVKDIIEDMAAGGVVGDIDYPTEAIHEIITNAVIHRDYSLKDDIHVRIFDNVLRS